MKYYRDLQVLAATYVAARLQGLPKATRIADTAALRLDMGEEDVKFAEAALSQVQRRVSALAKVDAANLRLAIDGASGIDPGVLAILERLEKVQN